MVNFLPLSTTLCSSYCSCVLEFYVTKRTGVTEEFIGVFFSNAIM